MQFEYFTNDSLTLAHSNASPILIRDESIEHDLPSRACSKFSSELIAFSATRYRLSFVCIAFQFSI
jgi:hypothetical protein